MDRDAHEEKARETVGDFLAERLDADGEDLEAALKNPASFSAAADLLRLALRSDHPLLCSAALTALLRVAPVLLKALKHPDKSENAADLLIAAGEPESCARFVEILRYSAVDLAEATRHPATSPGAYRVLDLLFNADAEGAGNAAEALLEVVGPEANRALLGRNASRFALEILVRACRSPRIKVADSAAVWLERLERGILSALGKEKGRARDDAGRLLDASLKSAGKKTRAASERILEKA